MPTPYDLPEWAAFVARIKADPADDLPRVVAADWLDEHGEPERAEFIRVQVAAWRHPARLLNPDATYGEYADLRQRELELIGRNVSDQPNTVCPQYYRWLDGIPDRMVPVRGFNLGADARPEEQCFRRGFVAEMRCRLADWIGSECELCDGNGMVPHDFPGSVVDGQCPACTGTGHTPGIGPAVVAAHPVERVVATGREPLESVFSNTPADERYGWVEEDADYDPPSIPSEVFRLLDRYQVGSDWAGYPSRQAAHDDLSAALLAHAKCRAGEVESQPT